MKVAFSTLSAAELGADLVLEAADDAVAGVRDLGVGQRLVQRLELHRVGQRALALRQRRAFVDVEQARFGDEGAAGDGRGDRAGGRRLRRPAARCPG